MVAVSVNVIKKGKTQLLSEKNISLEAIDLKESNYF